MRCHYKAATVETLIKRKIFDSFCKKHVSPDAYHVVRERDSFLLAPMACGHFTDTRDGEQAFLSGFTIF